MSKPHSHDQPAEDAAPPPPDTGALLAQLDAALADSAKYKEQVLRSMADLDNFRRRSARDMEETRRTAAASLIGDLVPALDNLRLGLQSAQQAHPEALAVIDGIKLIADQLRNVLAQHGLKEIDPLGQPFDAKFHESVAQQSSDKVPEGHVLQVFRPGYVLNDRLLRAASVVVSSGPEHKK
ncbi:MAG TPA: nucleotide exchange factor GrpE [Opitutales bacterium]|jgi:molecular chaperone GrpE|nr:nucleotide exchange factor GrpE [Opitutales bacterium]